MTDSTKRPQPGTSSRRQNTNRYELDDDAGISHIVCKSFFLTTLGLHPKKNDRMITTVLQSTTASDAAPPPDQRGSNHARARVDLPSITEHISSYHPTQSHYRREHAPNRLYLPSDISIKAMYDDFVAKHPDVQCSYSSYRAAVAKMNISFAQLGNEQCETCMKKADGHEEHLNRAKTSRTHYRTDADSDWPERTVIRSVDLQKVIMLPRMPGVKSAIFTKRIVAYHETFAVVGNAEKNKDKHVSVVWHEGISGRGAAQNKNWTLYTALATLVNYSGQHDFQDITLKYFEPGHTFMSADSVHAAVEKQMRRRPDGFVYDFADFVSVITEASRITVVPMLSSQIREWAGQQSQAKLKKVEIRLDKMVSVQFRKGSRSLFYKISHDQDTYTEFDFLMKKAKLTLPQTKRDAGVDNTKKGDIIKKLCPLMPESRQLFWKNL